MQKLIRRWFVHLHGEGADNQYDFYRCITCGRLQTWKNMSTGNMCCGGRVRPTNPKVLEIIRLFLLPWTF